MFCVLQVSRPITMKKEGIQSRNRKLSIKSRRRRRARSASTGNSMAAISSAKYNCDRSAAQMLFTLPPAASPLHKRSVTSYLGAGNISCGLVTPTGGKLSAEERQYYSSRYYAGDGTCAMRRHFPPHPSPSTIARYATSGCAAMMGGASHVTPWAVSSPYQHFAGACASSGIISAMV